MNNEKANKWAAAALHKPATVKSRVGNSQTQKIWSGRLRHLCGDLPSLRRSGNGVRNSPGSTDQSSKVPLSNDGDVQMNRCPRCRGWIPNDITPGAFPGAMSRTDNETEICSLCGTLEAIEQFTIGLTPQEHWAAVRETN